MVQWRYLQVMTMNNKFIWAIHMGDIVKVKTYELNGSEENFGVVVSKKFNDENTMFPCVLVYIFSKNIKQRCMPHQIEILSSAM